MTLLDRMKETQKPENHICPRCGQMNMRYPIHTNAMSRVADIFVCPDCGMDEALRDFGRIPLPIEEWFLPMLWKEAEE